MEQFVRVRIVQANSLDLAQFQFDYDLTFAAFFLNADGTIYGRYGSRSDQKLADREMSVEGFGKALASALALHKEYPANRAALAAKKGAAPRFKVPEEFPSLAGKYKPTLDYTGQVARSCIHCHQVHDAERKLLRDGRQVMPDEVVHPWPMPDVIGLSLDPAEMAKVRAVKAGSHAAKAGFQNGDEILSLEGQPILSINDVQWVLHNAPSPARLKAEVKRGRTKHSLMIDLPDRWRVASDITWRTSTWDLRRMALGGLVLKDVSDQDRRAVGLSTTNLALRIEYVGQYGEHAVAKRAGFKKDDVVVRVAERTERLTETDLLRELLQSRMPGAKVPAAVLRGTERVELTLPMQ